MKLLIIKSLVRLAFFAYEREFVGLEQLADAALVLVTGSDSVAVEAIERYTI